MRVLLGVTGGIAAYKAALVLRLLREDGHNVRVVPTAASLNFVGRATWEALSGQRASSDVFENVPSVEHVRLGQRADAILVAPATADFLASLASGRATDLLGNAILASEAPLVVAPAMHTEMWDDPATQANMATLRERGVHVVGPASGRLTGADSGVGRLAEPEDIVAGLYAASGRAAAGDAASAGEEPGRDWGDLVGVRVVVSAGGTREAIDSVRYIGNRSSGMQGFALAQAAHERGADVTVVAANVSLPVSEGVARVDVASAAELGESVDALAAGADVVIMAAAVSDFTPAAPSTHKLKKDGGAGLTLELTQTRDILRGLVERRAPGQTIVGFAAETGDDSASVIEHGRAKAQRKGADLLAVNAVGDGRGFGTPDNAVTLLSGSGELVGTAAGSKLAVAHAILDAVVAARAHSAS